MLRWPRAVRAIEDGSALDRCRGESARRERPLPPRLRFGGMPALGIVDRWHLSACVRPAACGPERAPVGGERPPPASAHRVDFRRAIRADRILFNREIALDALDDGRSERVSRQDNHAGWFSILYSRESRGNGQ